MSVGLGTVVRPFSKLMSCLSEHFPLDGTSQVPVASFVIPTWYVAAWACATNATEARSVQLTSARSRRRSAPRRAAVNAWLESADPA